jgi:hypothetical protein
MKPFLTTLTCILFFSISNAQVIIDFENATAGNTTFMAAGAEWTLTGDFLISEFENFSCSGLTGLNKYVDSGYLNGGSEGIVGSIATVSTDVTFQIATSTSQCVWIGRADGELLSSATIKFTGFKPDNTTIEESFELTTTSYTDLLAVNFSEAIWNGVNLSSLQLEIAATADETNYIAIDNLTLGTINLPTTITPIDQTNIQLFPNPTTDLISLQNINADQLEVYDSLGRLVMHSINPGNSINISKLQAGIYSLRIREGKQVFVAKVLKN